MSNTELQEYTAKLQQNYQKQFGQAALNYLSAGLRLFHQYRKKSSVVNPQAALGNLSIAVELMLKAFIASKNLILLFKGLPLEAKIMLTCPDSLPVDFKWRPFDIEMRSAKHKTIELGECIATFFIFFPQHKQSLHTHLKILSTYRNASVHHILPTFHKYELERAAFVALQIHDIVQYDKTLSIIGHVTTDDDDDEFLATFRESKLERVSKKIEEAKEHSKRIAAEDDDTLYLEVDWDIYIIRCPVCRSNALVFGYIESRTGRHGGEYLDFFTYGFLCDACGLELDDSEELKLAGVPTLIDRSDEFSTYVSDLAQDYYENL
jgi:hypothetical protein